MSGEHSLRPYYNHDTFDAGYLVIFKPGIGLVDTATNKPIVAYLGNNVSKSSNFGAGSIGLLGIGKVLSLDISVLLTDKNYVYDLELLEYFDVNNFLELFKNLVWNFMRNYCKVLISQPLEIARLVLQVGFFDFRDGSASSSASKRSRLKVESNSTADHDIAASSSDEADEAIDYFQLPWESSSGVTVSQKTNTETHTVKPRKARNPHKINPVSQHTIDIMAAVASKDGPFALFRGINASFIHYTLSHTIEAWITGFISPFLSIPDPFFLDLTHSTEPGKSLWLSVLACVLAGVVLMPLDLIKVRLMITQFNKPVSPTSSDSSEILSSESSTVYSEPSIDTRSVRESIRHFPRKVLLNPPPTITLLTILHQFSTTVFRKLAPYLLFVRYNIDSYLSPNLYTMVNLVLLIMELFIKLPLENLLRKEQVRFLLKPKSETEDKYGVVTIKNPEENLIVNFNGFLPQDVFDGDETDDRRPLTLWKRFRLLGLFNGWRVGVLNLIGFWGYNIFKSSGVITEERL